MMKSCSQCRQQFEITDADLAFYDKVSPVFNGKKEQVPPPTLCPACRMQRRLSWRNEKRLYHRKCDKTGKQILSIYSPDKPYTVYDLPEWYGDGWDPLSYGREFDFTRPFFEQFDELHHACPLRSFNLREENVNSDFTNLATRNRNCYLIFAANNNEDSYYSIYAQRDKNIVDCLFVFDSERCYECIDTYGGYNLKYCQYVDNCSDSSFLFNCRSCRHCFGCVNLTQKEYHMFNEKLTKEEYEKRLKTLEANPEFLAIARKRVQELQRTLPQKHYAGVGNESVTGDHVSYSKNTYASYDCTYLEDCKFCTWLHKSKECYDCYAWGFDGELSYESHLLGSSFQRVLFSESCWNSVSNLLYCRYCLDDCKDCFGCVSLRHKQYCILNKQYSREEYEALVPKIIAHMRKTPSTGSGQAGEWGEFLPTAISCYAYNETVAQEYFPLTKEEALARGWKWRDEDQEEQKYMGPKTDVPATIGEVTDDICGKILICEVTGRPYKINPQELRFYREMNVPLPRKCFDQRHKERRELRNPRRLWSRQCMNCKKSIETTYSPDRPEKVFCEECYLSTVY
jgi:hypothetical protein